MAKSNTMVAGIDVAKAKLDVAVHGRGESWTVDNAPAGFTQLVETLAAAGVVRVGLEASGGYERAVAAHLRQAGFSVLLLQPRQVRALAAARLQRAKSDRLDAALIAAFTALLGCERAPCDERLAALADPLCFLEQIEEDLKRAKTRLEHQHDPRIRALIEDDIARATARRVDEMARLLAALRAHDDLAHRLALLTSIAGIGERTALTLVIAMPELGSLTREEAAALAGLAPYDDDSGQRRGARRIAGGRARVRTALYRAALPAAHRWNPQLIALKDRLKAKGKNARLILTACARKLLVFANTVLARGTPWTPAPADH